MPLEAVADDESLWAELGEQAKRSMRPMFRALLEAGAEAAGEPGEGEKQLEIDTELQRQLLDGLVTRYTDEWWAALSRTTQSGLRKAIQAATAAGEPLEELIKRIEPLFGPERAERIAVTETTRLFAEGAKITYRAANVQQVEWRTARDPWVDPEICSPRDGERYAIDAAPEIPAHVRCRCFLAPVT